MAKRLIIEIDEDKCNGCGQCVLDCAEGALAIVDGKAKLIRDSYCDGLGACLSCPEGALQLIEREAEEFDEEAALAAKAEREGTAPAHAGHGAQGMTPRPGGCPGSMARALKPLSPVTAAANPGLAVDLPSWPIQLRLVPPQPRFSRALRYCWPPTVPALPCPICIKTGLPDAYLLSPVPSLKIMRPFWKSSQPS